MKLHIVGVGMIKDVLFTPMSTYDFYFQCLPNEKEEIEREHNLSRQGSLIKVPRDFTDSKHLIENEYKDHGYKGSAEYQDNNEYRDTNHYHLGQEKTPPPTETDF